MNQKQYTWSNKDKKFLSALLFLHFGLMMLIVSAFGGYWHTQTEDCRKLWKKVELSDWATDQVNKAQADQKLESLKESYNTQGVSAEEF